MPDVSASYWRPFDFIAFFWYFYTFLIEVFECSIVSIEVLYLQQTFTDCVYNQ